MPRARWSPHPAPPSGPAGRPENSAPPGADPGADVLLVTADTRLEESVGRLVALAGRPAFVAAPAAVTGSRWTRASVVVVGSDAVAALAQRRLTRRNGVLVMTGDRPGEVERQEVLRAALAVGAEDVLYLPDAEARLLRLLAISGRVARASVVGVVGARGGAGATTFACALAVTAARQGVPVALVDTDPLGSGVDLALGTEDAPGVRWSQLLGAGLDVGESALERVLPDLGGLLVLSCDDDVVARPEERPVESAEPIPGRALAAVLAALRASRELVVVDLPRHWPHEVGAALDLVNTALLITPAEVRATAAAVRVLQRLGNHVDDVRLVVRGPAPGGLTAGVVAEALGIPLAAELPAEPGLDTAYERGLPPARREGGPLATCARRLLPALTSPVAVPA